MCSFVRLQSETCLDLLLNLAISRRVTCLLLFLACFDSSYELLWLKEWIVIWVQLWSST